MEASRQFLQGEYHNDHGSAQVAGDGYIYNLRVHPDYQNQGHGHALLNTITARADDHKTTLMTNAREELHPFYGAHGFVPAEDDFGLGVPGLIRHPHQDS